MLLVLASKKKKNRKRENQKIHNFQDNEKKAQKKENYFGLRNFGLRKLWWNICNSMNHGAHQAAHVRLTKMKTQGARQTEKGSSLPVDPWIWRLKSTQSGKQLRLQKSDEDVIVRLQGFLKHRFDRKVGVDKQCLLERLELERSLLRACGKILTFLLILLVLMVQTQTQSPPQDLRLLLQAYETTFRAEDARAVSTTSEFFDYLAVVSEQTRALQPTSSDYFQNPKEQVLLAGCRELSAPLQIRDEAIRPHVELPSFTFTAWLGPQEDTGYIVRKLLSPKSPSLCWGWFFESGRRALVFGSHDFGGPDMLDAAAFTIDARRRHFRGSKRIESEDVFVTGDFIPVGLHFEVLIVTPEEVIMYQDGRLIGSAPLPRRVTDCSGDAFEAGSAGVKTCDVTFYPRRLAEKEIAEMFEFGMSLGRIAEGQVLKKPAPPTADVSAGTHQSPEAQSAERTRYSVPAAVAGSSAPAVPLSSAPTGGCGGSTPCVRVIGVEQVEDSDLGYNYSKLLPSDEPIRLSPDIPHAYTNFSLPAEWTIAGWVRIEWGMEGSVVILSAGGPRPTWSLEIFAASIGLQTGEVDLCVLGVDRVVEVCVSASSWAIPAQAGFSHGTDASLLAACEGITTVTEAIAACASSRPVELPSAYVPSFSPTQQRRCDLSVPGAPAFKAGDMTWSGNNIELAKCEGPWRFDHGSGEALGTSALRHVAFTVAGGAFRAYIDGELAGEYPFPALYGELLSAATTEVRLGQRADGRRALRGEVARLSLFPRPLATPALRALAAVPALRECVQRYEATDSAFRDAQLRSCEWYEAQRRASGQRCPQDVLRHCPVACGAPPCFDPSHFSQNDKARTLPLVENASLQLFDRIHKLVPAASIYWDLPILIAESSWTKESISEAIANNTFNNDMYPEPMYGFSDQTAMAYPAMAKGAFAKTIVPTPTFTLPAEWKDLDRAVRETEAFTISFWARPIARTPEIEGQWNPQFSFMSSFAPPQELATIRAVPGALRLHYRPFDRCGPRWEEGVWLRLDAATLPRGEWTRFSFWLDRGELGLMVNAQLGIK